MIEHQRQCDRAALADERDAALAPPAHDLVGPERHTVEEIDEAVTVGAEERQLAGTLEQLLGEARALRGGGLGKAGREAHEAAGAAPHERGGNPRHLAVRCGDEGGIGRGGQLVDRAEITLRRRGGPLRMNAPDFARVADHAARSERGIGPGTADQCERARREQPLQHGRVHGVAL